MNIVIQSEIYISRNFRVHMLWRHEVLSSVPAGQSDGPVYRGLGRYGNMAAKSSWQVKAIENGLETLEYVDIHYKNIGAGQKIVFSISRVV